MTIPVALVCLTAIVLYAMRLYERRGARQVLKLLQAQKLTEDAITSLQDRLTVAVDKANEQQRALDLIDKGMKGHAQTLNTLAMGRGVRPG
jgi:hypothetical protein